MKIIPPKSLLYAIIIVTCSASPIKCAGIVTHAQNITTYFALAYAMSFVTTCAHESGHALVNTLLTKEPFHIYIGSNYSRSKSTPPLFTTKYISITGLNPLIGHARYYQAFENLWINNIRTFAGPCAGVLFGYLLYKKTDQKNFFWFLVTIHTIISNIVQLIPFYGDSQIPFYNSGNKEASTDGAKIWENIKLLYAQWKNPQKKNNNL